MSFTKEFADLMKKFEDNKNMTYEDIGLYTVLTEHYNNVKNNDTDNIDDQIQSFKDSVSFLYKRSNNPGLTMTNFKKNPNIDTEILDKDDDLAVNDLSEQIKSNKNIVYKYNRNGQLHSDFGPALIEYHDDHKFLFNNIKRKEYYKNGVLDNARGPAIIYYDNKNNIAREEWYYNGHHCTQCIIAYLMENNKKTKHMSEKDFIDMWEYINKNDKNIFIEHNTDDEVETFNNIQLYDSGKLKTKINKNDNNELQDLNHEPGFIRYYENGRPSIILHYQNGLPHYFYGPAEIIYDELGTITSSTWYYEGNECTDKVENYLLGANKNVEELTESELGIMWSQILNSINVSNNSSSSLST